MIAAQHATHRQVHVDAAADEAALVAGDVVILETIRDRVAHTLDVATRNRIEASIAELRNGVDAGDLSSASEIAEELRTALS